VNHRRNRPSKLPAPPTSRSIPFVLPRTLSSSPSMSFRKRNVGLSGSARSDPSTQSPSKIPTALPGARPSSVDGRPTTSTGTASLDALFAGHGGLALGCSVLVEESGTTDYAGALLRFYAAEGLLQGHHVHVVGMPEHWGRELPGVVGESDKSESPTVKTEKMKIAWRYESLGQFGANTHSRGGHLRPCSIFRTNASCFAYSSQC
jgi:elongator complex protein 4